MKRGKKLLSLLIVLAVLAGLAAAVQLINPDGEDGDTETETITVFDVGEQTITGIGWSYEDVDLSFSYKEDAWQYDDDSDFPVDAAPLETMADTLSLITSEKVIESPEDLAEYGLEEPVCTIRVTVDGTTHQLLLGAETSMGGQRYLSNGDGNVYLVDDGIADDFLYELYDLLEEESIPAMSDVTALNIDAQTQQMNIQYLPDSGIAYSDEYVWFLNNEALDTELTEALLKTVTGLSWNSCVNYKADDAALAEYGLDAPAVVVTVEYTKTVTTTTNETDEDGNAVTVTEEIPSSFVLEIGGYGEDDTCYARIQGSSMVYLIDADICDTLLYTRAEDLQPDEVLAMDLDELTAMDIILDGETYRFEKGTMSITDSEGNTTEETVYRLNGEVVDLDDVLTDLGSIGSEGYASGVTPERSEEIRFVLYRENAVYPKVELVFYQYNSTGCLTMLNGEATVFATREDIVTLIEDVNDLVLG